MKQHRTVILPSFATIFLCSLLLSASFTAFGAVMRILSMEKNLYAVEAFLPEMVGEDSLKVIGDRLKHTKHIDSVSFVSADSALADFRRHFSGDMLDLVEGNPIPPFFRNNVVSFVAGIEELPIMPDNIAKVVVNERTGTIVMGGDVAVDNIAITQGGISISIETEQDVSQPMPYSMGSGAKTVTTKNDNVSVSEEKANTIVLDATANVNDIVGALNAVGATPRDIISILQAMKAAGALHAELEII